MNRRLGKFTLSMLLTVSVAACASQPEDIGATYVSDLNYQNYSCDQLAQESRRVSTQVSTLHGQLDEKADNDAVQMGVGLVLLWPTLFFLEGGDGADAAEYSRLKGESEAINRASIQKNCGFQETTIEPVTASQSNTTTESNMSVEERLQQIESWKADGLITETEAEDLRQKVLDSI